MNDSFYYQGACSNIEETKHVLRFIPVYTQYVEPSTVRFIDRKSEENGSLFAKSGELLG